MVEATRDDDIDDEARRIVDQWTHESVGLLREHYRRLGRDVVIHAPARCRHCVGRGHAGRPILTEGVRGPVRWHTCPRCDARFVSIELVPATFDRRAGIR